MVPVASECLEGGSGVFCNMQAPDIVFSSKVVTNLFFSARVVNIIEYSFTAHSTRWQI